MSKTMPLLIVFLRRGARAIPYGFAPAGASQNSHGAPNAYHGRAK